jgi:hypothetical protein
MTLRGGTNAVSINGSAGAWTAITCTQSTRRVQIQEDPSNNPLQGFQFQLVKDGYAYTYEIPAGGSYVIGDTLGVQGSGEAPTQGVPEQNAANGTSAFNYRAPTEYMKAKSLTVTATTLQVLEED